MKKITAILLVLALSLMFTFAFAEKQTFGMACVTDLEGNVLYAVLEDNTVVDAEGNPVESIPYITVTLDDEALTFQMSTADKTIAGTIEVLESTDTQAALQLIPEEGNAVAAFYTTEEINMLTVVDENNGMMVMMVEAA